MKLQLIIADDHPTVVLGLKSLLEKDKRFELIGSASNGMELLNLKNLEQSDVILLDLNMPGIDGLSALKELRRKKIKSKIIIYSHYDAFDLIKECKVNGANGYLLKSTQSNQLLPAIFSIYKGQEQFPNMEEKELQTSKFSYFDDFLKKYKLTKREVEIIKLVCQNLRTKDIAELLCLSEFTIHTHRKNIMRKLEISDSTVALYEFAIKTSLVSS
jgi:DNA-binding NarL/FixJ family response regulator